MPKTSCNLQLGLPKHESRLPQIHWFMVVYHHVPCETTLWCLLHFDHFLTSFQSSPPRIWTKLPPSWSKSDCWSTPPPWSRPSADSAARVLQLSRSRRSRARSSGEYHPKAQWDACDVEPLGVDMYLVIYESCVMQMLSIKYNKI